MDSRSRQRKLEESHPGSKKYARCFETRPISMIYGGDEWRRLVGAYAVSGKNAHDARLVAAMKVHGITHILSFNSGDFARYPEVTVIEPSTLSLNR
jgi:predicted nucleic acid-binding protein